LFLAITIVSAVSFFGFGIGYLVSPAMRQEFIRYGLGEYRATVAILQLTGAAAQIAGLKYPLLGVIASGGLALMMCVALLVRKKIGDRIEQWIPAALYFAANVYLAAASMYR
jgi:hypothetical protein